MDINLLTNYMLDEQGNITPIQTFDAQGNPNIENLIKWGKYLESADRQIGDNFYRPPRLKAPAL